MKSRDGGRLREKVQRTIAQHDQDVERQGDDSVQKSVLEANHRVINEAIQHLQQLTKQGCRSPTLSTIVEQPHEDDEAQMVSLAPPRSSMSSSAEHLRRVEDVLKLHDSDVVRQEGENGWSRATTPSLSSCPLSRPTDEFDCSNLIQDIAGDNFSFEDHPMKQGSEQGRAKQQHYDYQSSPGKSRGGHHQFQGPEEDAGSPEELCECLLLLEERLPPPPPDQLQVPDGDASFLEGSSERLYRLEEKPLPPTAAQLQEPYNETQAEIRSSSSEKSSIQEPSRFHSSKATSLFEEPLEPETSRQQQTKPVAKHSTKVTGPGITPTLRERNKKNIATVLETLALYLFVKNLAQRLLRPQKGERKANKGWGGLLELGLRVGKMVLVHGSVFALVIAAVGVRAVEHLAWLLGGKGWARG
ncbi:hypothetical protein VTI74DRAFT_1207 [Chaetomium olivicolor]